MWDEPIKLNLDDKQIGSSGNRTGSVTHGDEPTEEEKRAECKDFKRRRVREAVLKGNVTVWILCKLHPRGTHSRLRVSGLKRGGRAGPGILPSRSGGEGTRIRRCGCGPALQSHSVWQDRAGATGGAREGSPRQSRIFPMASGEWIARDDFHPSETTRAFQNVQVPHPFHQFRPRVIPAVPAGSGRW